MAQLIPPQDAAEQNAQNQLIPDIDSLPDGLMHSGNVVDRVLGISTSTRLRMEKAGLLKVYRFGRSKRYMNGNVKAVRDAACEAA